MVVGSMSSLSLRLPQKLIEKLDEESRLIECPRSEVARRALAEWLDAQEKKRFMEAMARAAKAIYSDPETAAELRQIDEALDSVDTTAERIEAEERSAGIDPDRPWWN